MTRHGRTGTAARGGRTGAGRRGAPRGGPPQRTRAHPRADGRTIRYRGRPRPDAGRRPPRPVSDAPVSTPPRARSSRRAITSSWTARSSSGQRTKPHRPWSGPSGGLRGRRWANGDGGPWARIEPRSVTAPHHGRIRAGRRTAAHRPAEQPCTARSALLNVEGGVPGCRGGREPGLGDAGAHLADASRKASLVVLGHRIRRACFGGPTTSARWPTPSYRTTDRGPSGATPREGSPRRFRRPGSPSSRAEASPVLPGTAVRLRAGCPRLDPIRMPTPLAAHYGGS